MVIQNADHPEEMEHVSVRSGKLDKNRRNFYTASWLVPIPLGAVAGSAVGMSLVDVSGIGFIGGVVGVTGILLSRNSIEPRFVINNSTTQVFLTFDPVKRWLGRSDILTLYPPGPSLCYPWEQRYSENTISLKEATVTFEFTVTCIGGVLKGRGSFRLAADDSMPVKFQRGVASVAEDLRDLIITEALQQLATKTVADAMLSIEEVNTALAKMFVVGNTPFEIRFGIIVGDVTIGELLPSKELRRTLSAQTEALAIAQGTAILLGYSSMRAVKAAIKSGAITTNDQKEARDRFLSVSGNLEGMDIKRNELVLTAAEIDPKFAEAIMALAQNAPDLIRAWRDKGGNNGGPKK